MRLDTNPSSNLNPIGDREFHHFTSMRSYATMISTILYVWATWNLLSYLECNQKSISSDVTPVREINAQTK